ncbi:hypothetical protein C922_01818 [Plasmodium inui San Antonio 1]|uniref:C2 domain-containing protein n=1 Tax=Plasmodium inui San Antonio 1 TaxID=1237626 RepID=W7A8L6_9APIC|nr:hypothetical protein C922_01818 [Plasmodium inui San Antonio 1]EUD67633.1 hypothetical protein C922_01818 [Plasmodium inui San Antonio 1]
MRKKKKSNEGKVWMDALHNLEEVHQNKYSLTKDTLHERSRPEPEIIENILEELENKIRFYFKLYKMEKDKRADCEKKNYDLHEELNKTYTILQKNKLYTDKLETKLLNIKENQSSLIDTVRRIDLLYIQLDTLVQSFSGVCTQVAADVNAYGVSTNSKRNTIKTLLDYIYPCRTLDPRINSLYGVLYYGSIGLLKDGKFVSPPVPPIPPVVPSEGDGWLPPSGYGPHNGVLPTDYQQSGSQERRSHERGSHQRITHQRCSHLGAAPGGSFSDSGRRSGSALNREESSKDNYADDAIFSKYVEEEQTKQVRSEYDDEHKPNCSELLPHDLQGFCIRIGFLEIDYKKENARIICVVRYDRETSTSAIQNTTRVTKPKDMDARGNGGKCIFNIDYTINLTSLPEKNAGDIPRFMIDVHDVNGKALIGTSVCSFISEKTLVRDASWDIYSRVANSKPEIIGKMHVSVFACPPHSLLPAEIFSRARKQSTLLAPHGGNNPGDAPSGDDRKVESSARVTFQKSTLLSKVIEERDQPSQMQGRSHVESHVKSHAQPQGQSHVKPLVQSPVKPLGQPHAQPLSANNTGKGASRFQRGNKVIFKPYISKNADSAASTNAKKSNSDVKENTPQKEASTRISLNQKNGESSSKNGESSSKNGEKKSGTLSLVQSRIKNLAKRLESKNGTSEGIEKDGSSGSTTPVEGSARKLGGLLKKSLPLSSSNGPSDPKAKEGEQQGEQKVGKTEGQKTAQMEGQKTAQMEGQTEGQKTGQKTGQTEGQKTGQKTAQTEGQKTGQKTGQKDALEKGPVALKKISPVVKDGVMKIKLPLPGKKDSAKKAGPVTSAKNDTAISNPAKSDPADAAKKESNTKDNHLASKTIKPILKIKVEPKKENLSKLLKEFPPKITLAPREQEDKGSDAAKKATPSEKMTGMTAPTASKADPLIASKADPLIASKADPPTVFKGAPPTDAQAARPIIFRDAALTDDSTEGGAQIRKVERRLQKKLSIKNKMLSLLKMKPRDPSTILKKPVPKPVSNSVSNPTESHSSIDGPDLKNLLEKAKKTAIFIDKNKVNAKLNKKVEVKREIKKFVPKLKNFE